MPKKPEVVLTDPRLLAKGTVIWHKGNQSEEVIRNVTVVAQLANGESQSYLVGVEEIEVLKEQPSPVAKGKIMAEKDLPEEAEARMRIERLQEQVAQEETLLKQVEALQAKNAKMRENA